MQKVLIVTVGGSPQPIITALQTLQPDRAIFLCSTGNNGSISQVTGEETPCQIREKNGEVKRLPNIPTQVELGERFKRDRDVFEIDNSDDLSECYRKAVSAIQSCRQDLANVEVMADYTGGTKTMSAGLVMASLDQQATLYVTTKDRDNIVSVKRGERTGKAIVTPLLAQRTIEQLLASAFKDYSYSAIIGQLKDLLRTVELPTEEKRKIDQLGDCCTGFEAWDRFDHQMAWDFLQPQMKRQEIQPLGIFLKRILSSREIIDETFSSPDGSKGHGYELVQDLLLNAQRRAKQERYDDAVGRLYRALELLVQIRLFTGYEIKTNNVAFNQLPESLQTEYESQRSTNNKIRLGLRDSYTWLSEFPEDPLGQLYQERDKYLLDALNTRNNSLFAHGFQPIDKTTYDNISQTVIDFIQEGIARLISTNFDKEPPQFPTHISL